MEYSLKRHLLGGKSPETQNPTEFRESKSLWRFYGEASSPWSPMRVVQCSRAANEVEMRSGAEQRNVSYGDWRETQRRIVRVAWPQREREE